MRSYSYPFDLFVPFFPKFGNPDNDAGYYDFYIFIQKIYKPPNIKILPNIRQPISKSGFKRGQRK